MHRFSSIDNLFFTGDHHFGHENIIKYCGRPFSCSEEMDSVLVDNWNAVVSSGDTVFHVGDFSLSGDVDYVKSMFSRLNGKIYFVPIWWHHDSRWLSAGSTMKSADGEPVRMIDTIDLIRFPGIKKQGFPLCVTLSHYPMAEWEASHYGAWHLHGHSHGNYSDPLWRNIVDVGVDFWSYRPVSFGEIFDKMRSIGFGGEWEEQN